MKKFPTYELSIEVASGNVVIELPFTLEFQVSRANLSSSNTASFRLYNLKKETRDQIFQDYFKNTTVLRLIRLRAGYQNFRPIIFNGTVQQAQSVRIGSDMVTEIDAVDGACQMANGFTSTTQAAGRSASDILNQLSGTLPQLSGTPIVGSFPVASSRGEVLFGNTWGLIFEKSGGLATIDNGQVKILQPDEAIAPGGTASVPVINSATGLLESPRRSTGNNFVEVNLLFEPRLTLGQLVQLDSGTNSLFNGTYNVVGFKHQGIISPSVDGSRTTRAFLFRGEGTFTGSGFKVIQGEVVQ